MRGRVRFGRAKSFEELQQRHKSVARRAARLTFRLPGSRIALSARARERQLAKIIQRHNVSVHAEETEPETDAH